MLQERRFPQEDGVGIGGGEDTLGGGGSRSILGTLGECALTPASQASFAESWGAPALAPQLPCAPTNHQQNFPDVLRDTRRTLTSPRPGSGAAAQRPGPGRPAPQRLLPEPRQRMASGTRPPRNPRAAPTTPARLRSGAPLSPAPAAVGAALSEQRALRPSNGDLPPRGPTPASPFARPGRTPGCIYMR